MLHDTVRLVGRELDKEIEFAELLLGVDPRHEELEEAFKCIDLGLEILSTIKLILISHERDMSTIH